MKQHEYDHEMMRRKFWISIWQVMAGTKSDNCSEVADRALKAFDKRFPAKETSTNTFRRTWDDPRIL